MQAHRFPEMLEMIAQGRLRPDKLIGKTISLDESAQALSEMNAFTSKGITVINEF